MYVGHADFVEGPLSVSCGVHAPPGPLAGLLLTVSSERAAPVLSRDPRLSGGLCDSVYTFIDARQTSAPTPAGQ
jgi:hypothetical protein